MQVYVIGGNNQVTIEHIPAGEYTIYENNVLNAHQGDKWTWRYTDTLSQEANVNNSLDGDETEIDTVTFTYTSTGENDSNGVKTIKNWLNGFSHRFHSIIKGN